MRRHYTGTYIGEREELRGKRAMLMLPKSPYDEGKQALAKFYDEWLKESSGWWPFDQSDFKIDEGSVGG